MLRKLLTIALITAIIDAQADAQAFAQQAPEQTAEVNSNHASSAREAEKPNEAQLLSPGKAKIAAGTTLEFGLIHPLSSATARAGDDVPLRLLRPLVAGDTTLLAAGAIVHGRLEVTKPAGPNCQNGNLQLTINRLSFRDGTSVKVENGLITSDETKPVPYKTALPWDPNWLEISGLLVVLAPLVVVGAALYAVFVGPAYLLGIYPIALNSTIPCAQGKNIDMPASTRVAVVVKKNHTVHF